jgi:ABC-type lipoprotein release transport system permease subunit
MTVPRFLLRSVLHYRFAYLGVFAGAVLGATVLLGALFAGDSVAASLRRIAEQRLGRTTHVLAAGDRFFRDALAADFAAAARVDAAPVLLARGTATRPDTRAAANQVQLLGITPAFWTFAPTPPAITLSAAKSEAAVNETLARRLGLSVGSTLVVRLRKPGVLAGNAPIAGADPKLESVRLTVAAIVGDAAFGRFNLEATQVPPPSVYLPLELLQSAFARPGRANLLLLAAPIGSDSGSQLSALSSQLSGSLRLPDYGLTLKWRERAAAFDLVSEHIFLDPAASAALTAAVPSAAPVISYLINEYRVGDRTAPYAIGGAAAPAAAPFLPADLGPREVVLNQWLADDLAARVGDELRATYFQTGAADTLVEKSAAFRVRAIVPLAGLAADRDWMPDFPGIADAKSQSEWDPGLPLDLKKIRPHDEKYWDDHRGTPKAWFSLAAGRELWGTRWGDLTALRFALPAADAAGLERTLLAALRPEHNQLFLRDVRASAAASAQSAVDFGGLFLGLSFFLILAALGLVAMLFQLGLLQRNREDALLGAVGLAGPQLLRWRLGEAVVILLAGLLVGLPLAALYTRGILRFLETIWAGQGAGPTFAFAATPASIAIGAVAFLLCSLGAIWLALRRQAKRALSIRLAAGVEETAPAAHLRRNSLRLAVAALVVGAGALAASGRGLPAQGAFYLAGFAGLVAGLAACRAWLARPPAAGTVALDAAALGALNLKARRSRNLTVVGLIAVAVFMVLSVASFRKHVGADWLTRASGTGGFAFWLETTLPQNPARDGSTQGFELFGRAAADLGAVVPFRAGAGDNVNCFNLNTTLQPRLLATDTAKLAALGAFKIRLWSDLPAPATPPAAALPAPATPPAAAPATTPAATTPAAAPPTASGSVSAPGSVSDPSSVSDLKSPISNPSPWSRLAAPTAAGAIPALVDENTLLWALKRKLGDVLDYTDESGRPFTVQLVGVLPDSIFQGHLVVDERLFLQKFPSSAGYTLFLADAKNPAGDLVALRDRLATAATDAGAKVELTRDILAAFHGIENTYIAIFNVLGALGLVLGSLGLAIVVARNLRERRDEFAVLAAIGLPRAVLARMVYAEFSRLVVWGLAIGAVASVVAIWPSLTALPAAPTVALIAAMLAGVVVLNLLCGWLVFRWSTRTLRPGLGSA